MESTHGLKSLVIWTSLIIIVWILNQFVMSEISPYLFTIIMLAGVNIILAVSLNLVNGFTGQFSMGHAGFMAVGAYISAMTTTYTRDLAPDLYAQIPSLIFLGSLIAGAMGAAFVGYLVGLPTLRLKGDYLAIVTLGFGEIIRVVLLNTEAAGGARGLPNIPPLSSFGWVYTFTILTTLIIWRTISSSYGRALLAVREDEIAAESMGVNTTQAKVRAFVMGSFFAGLGGGLFAHFLQYLNPSIFTFNRSFEYIIMVVLGGMGSLTGSVIAAILLTFIPEALRDLQQYTGLDFRMVIYSLILIILMLTRPNGLFGQTEFMDYLPKSLRRKMGRREAEA